MGSAQEGCGAGATQAAGAYIKYCSKTTYSCYNGRAGIPSAARVGPPVGCVQHRQHRAPLRALTDFARPSKQLGLAAPQPVHRDQHALVGARANGFLLELLDRAHVGGLGHADLAVVDLDAELRHQRRLDVAHDLLGLHVAGGQYVDLTYLAQRRHDHARRQHACKARDQVLGTFHPPRIGRLPGGCQRQRVPVAAFRDLSRIRRCHVDRSPVATWFRPEALARYNARSAATSTSSVSGPRPARNSATPMLTVTSPDGYPRSRPITSTPSRTLSATTSAPCTPVRTSTRTNSSPP